MTIDFKAALQRAGRVLVAGVASSGVIAIPDDVAGSPEKILLSIIITALINAFGKYCRDKWGLRLPV